MNNNLSSRPAGAVCSNRSVQVRLAVVTALAMTALLLSPLAAQTTIVVLNAGFESPTPTSLPGYTVGATDWTRTRLDINSGTFEPSLASPPNPTPAPIDGFQVGYADGSGGLQQVFTDTFAANRLYTFSVYIGFRSDELNSNQGTGAITLGYFNAGTFTALSSQSITVTRGNFDFVTGSYQTSGAAQGMPIALQLTSIGSYQVLFDVAQLSFTAIPEPSAFACTLGVGALGLAWIRHRGRRKCMCT